MKTDELIDQLASDLAPVPPMRFAGRILLGLGLGSAVSAAVMLLWLGVRPDLADATTTPMYWMKFGYTLLSFAALAVALMRIARPGGSVGSLVWAVATPFALVVLMALWRLGHAPPEMRHALMMGGSSSVCPWRILVLSLPILAGAVWALRGMAPTRLVLAGLLAGGCAGAMGAWIYAFHCDESASPFVAIWYTLGMGAVALIGALAGKKLLRW